ncbi:LysR family transcriptional regulator [Cupriavidus sp. YAF13]|uniref:LysR family transcriptional regulator n=1 Tax=Cupriavidus sp. YAF13 TaxID=3233075 RepID=UPI003F936C43
MEDENKEPNWAHLYSLVVLGELGSYTAAAVRLGLSKGAMSQRIAELERSAGVPLVQRTTRSVRLTEAGQQLADTTRNAFSDIERSFAGVRDLAGEPRGLLRVTAPVALGRQQIVPRIPAFLKAYPEVRIEMEFSDKFTALAQEGFDLAIRHASVAPDTHIAWTLCRTNTVLVATRSYLKRHGSPETPAELAEHACLHYFRRGESPTWSFEPLRGTGPRRSVAIHGSFAANNSEALREAALGGLGIALLPDFTAQADVAAGRLVKVLPNWRPAGAFGDHLFAIRPYSPYLPRAVRVFVDHLRETLKDGFTMG